MLAERPPIRLGDEAAWDQKEMPFTEHLRELRKRLLISHCHRRRHRGPPLLALAVRHHWMMNEYFHGIELHAFGPADVIFAEFKFSLDRRDRARPAGPALSALDVRRSGDPSAHAPHGLHLHRAVDAAGCAGLAFAHFVVIPRVIAALIVDHQRRRRRRRSASSDDQFRAHAARALRADLSDCRSSWSGSRASASSTRRCWEVPPVRVFGMFVVGGMPRPTVTRSRCCCSPCRCTCSTRSRSGSSSCSRIVEAQLARNARS